jgi:hypothetical protein
MRLVKEGWSNTLVENIDLRVKESEVKDKAVDPFTFIVTKRYNYKLERVVVVLKQLKIPFVISLENKKEDLEELQDLIKVRHFSLYFMLNFK